MVEFIGRFGPSHPYAGKLVERFSSPLINAAGAALKFYNAGSRYAIEKSQEMRERLSRGEPVYLLGIGLSGHNSAAALLEVSQKDGLRLICNNEEERYTGIKHEGSFPKNALVGVLRCLQEMGLKTTDILAVVASWDYLAAISTGLRIAVEEAPVSLLLTRRASSPQMNLWHFLEALKAPYRLKKFFKTKRRVPVIGLRHHDNHAYFSYAMSPFAQSSDPVMVAAIDGYGDDGPISLYVAKPEKVEIFRSTPGFFDSLGLLYSIISSTQGGWTTLSSEGRYMGASAWGDTSRLTNPYYKRLRQILYLGPDGQVFVNRLLINYHRRGIEKPYGKRLVEILGEPIPPEKMWNPDSVLDITDIEHAEITQERVDKAAALQLVFEDALFHIVDHLIRSSGSHQLVLTGGTALNCVANLKLLEHFNESYYLRNLGQKNTRLHLWVPPTPSDTGAAIGAACHFALRHGAPLGSAQKHAFFCGAAPTADSINQAIAQAEDTESLALGNVYEPEGKERVADLIAYIVARDGVIGMLQGPAETGPRALGHRTILANPCNPETLKVLNMHVKYRERIRPLAPMVTLEEAQRLFNLSDGASDDNYNAYNYMVLVAEAKKESYSLVPAVIHRDGTSRIQIVRKETDPFSYAILKAMGRRLGVEVAVNTSLNVGSPIVQTPAQAIQALHRSRGMTGLLLVGGNGTAYLVWHNIEKSPKDAGRRLMQWVQEWRADRARADAALIA